MPFINIELLIGIYKIYKVVVNNVIICKGCKVCSKGTKFCTPFKSYQMKPHIALMLTQSCVL